MPLRPLKRCEKARKEATPADYGAGDARGSSRGDARGGLQRTPRIGLAWRYPTRCKMGPCDYWDACRSKRGTKRRTPRRTVAGKPVVQLRTNLLDVSWITLTEVVGFLAQN